MFLLDLLSFYFLALTGVIIFWTVQIRALNGSSYARIMLLLCIAISIYLFGYTMELNAYREGQILFWNKMQYIGLPFISALWLTAVMMYTEFSIGKKKILYIAIYLIPIVTAILRLTNEYHHLYFSAVKYVNVHGTLFLVQKFGIWMNIQMIHSILIILISMGLLIREPIQGKERWMGRNLLILAASFIAISGLTISIIKPFGLYIDYMAVCLPIACLFVILAIVRFDLLEIKSIGRNKAFESATDAMLLINSNYRVLDYNNSAKKLFHRININLENRNLLDMINQAPTLILSMKNPEASTVTLEIDGEVQYYLIATNNIVNHGTLRGWVKTIRNVTKIHQLTEELKKQAMTDVLSHLYNRRAFLEIGEERLDAFPKKDDELYLFMMDFDHFKHINDQYGHPAGDVTIRDFGKILSEHFGTESLIARIGGEEFAVLDISRNQKEMLDKIKALQQKTRQYQYSFESSVFNVTISIGITKNQPGDTLEDMMQRADKALYRSKDKGRNCYTVL